MMPTTITPEQTPEIHSIANLSPVSPAPVHSTTAAALPAIQSRAESIDNAQTERLHLNTLTTMHSVGAHASSKDDRPPETPKDVDVSDDDLYAEAELEASSLNHEKVSNEQPVADIDDEYAKTFDSDPAEEGEKEEDISMGGTSGAERPKESGPEDVSPAQPSNPGAAAPGQDTVMPDASSTRSTAPATAHTQPTATSPTALSSSDIPLMSASPTSNVPATNAELESSALPVPADESLQISQQTSEAVSPSGTETQTSSLAALSLAGKPAAAQDVQGIAPSSLPQAPMATLANGTQSLPPASADLPSRPPVDMNRMHTDPSKGGPTNQASQSKVPSSLHSGPITSVTGPLPNHAPAPGTTDAVTTLGPPPGPSHPSLPAVPPPSAHASGPAPLYYRAVPTGPSANKNGKPPGDFQKKWEQYVADEKRYTADQKWERFPDGSRLFIGNLSSDKVSKRDVFGLFYRFGRLAQISLKSAYGFVQYHTAEEAQAAVGSLQGAEVKGRKIHLEFTKTQKKKERQEDQVKSPDKGVRGGRDSRHQGGRHDRNQENRRSRDDTRQSRHMDEYRPPPREDAYGRDRPPYDNHRSRDRSFSPRSRGRDREYRHRSRSPYSRSAAVPDNAIPRPYERSEPPVDVQLLLMQEVRHDYITWVRDAFAERGLRTDVMHVNPSYQVKKDVISRLVVDGVSAMVELDSSGEHQGEVYLHLYDLSGGLNNVRFTEYQGLKPNVAADMVARNKPKGPVYPPAPGPAHPPAHHPPVHHPHHANPYGSAPPVGYPAPQAHAPYSAPGLGVYPPTHQPPAAPAAYHNGGGADPAVANLQQILSQLQQNPAAAAALQGVPGAAPAGQGQAPAGGAVNIQAILDSLKTHAGGASGNAALQSPTAAGYAPVPAAVAAGTYHASGGQGGVTAGSPAGNEAHVQNIMTQLARFRQ